MVYIPKYRIILDETETYQKNILYYKNKEQDLMVYILEEPSWKYHIIDELEQFQIFPLKLLYNNEIILERVGISNKLVVYKISNEKFLE